MTKLTKIQKRNSINNCENSPRNLNMRLSTREGLRTNYEKLDEENKISDSYFKSSLKKENSLSGKRNKHISFRELNTDDSYWFRGITKFSKDYELKTIGEQPKIRSKKASVRYNQVKLRESYSFDQDFQNKHLMKNKGVFSRQTDSKDYLCLLCHQILLM